MRKHPFTNIFARNAKSRGNTNQPTPTASKPKIADGYTYYKSGYREDLLEYMKSKMEANIYRWYRWKVKRGDIIDVQYEPTLFRIKLGEKKTYYRPDFRVCTKKGIYFVEVKGPPNHPSLEKVRALQRSRNRVDIYVLDHEKYKLVQEHYASLVPHWE